MVFISWHNCSHSLITQVTLGLDDWYDIQFMIMGPINHSSQNNHTALACHQRV